MPLARDELIPARTTPSPTWAPCPPGRFGGHRPVRTPHPLLINLPRALEPRRPEARMAYNSSDFVRSQSNAPAVNTAAIVTLANPGATLRWRVRMVVASYNAAPTGGNLTIADGANVNWSVDIANASVFTFVLGPFELLCTANNAVVITLAAAGAAVTGKLNVLATID